MSKKLRADALESRLQAAGKTEALAALDRWIFEEGARLSDCASRLQSEFGHKCSTASLSAFCQRRRAERAVNQITNSKEAADLILALGRSEEIDEATLSVVAQKTFDLAVGEKFDPQLLVSLTGLLLKKRTQDLDREKFALLKRKAEQAEQTEQAVSNDNLTDEERAQRIKEIYGRA